MKNVFIKLKDRLLNLSFLLLIMFFIYLEDLRESSFLLAYASLVLLVGSIVFIGFIFELTMRFSSSKKKKRTQQKKIEYDGLYDFLLFNSVHIIRFSFYIYFFLYIMLGFYKMDVTFNYILLVLFGMYVGSIIVTKMVLKELANK